MGYKDSRSVTYGDLVFRHLDRMSDSLSSGMDVGKPNTALLTSYYLHILHFQSMLTKCITGSKLKKIRTIKAQIPAVATMYNGSLKDSIVFLEAISEWFEILLIVASESNVLSMTPRAFNDYNNDTIEEMSAYGNEESADSSAKS